MADIDLVWKELISRLKQAKESVPGKATALCPAHNDKNPSLSVKLTDQKILFNCHAGCSFTAIVSALNMNINQFNTKNSKPKKRRQEVCRYDYRSEDGELLYQVVRYNPKDFRPCRADGKYTLKGVQRVPYLLENLSLTIERGEKVFFVEGEKYADRGNKEGLYCTTVVGGAGKWRSEYEKYFLAAEVILIPDNDDAGFRGVQRIAGKISSVSKSIKIMPLPGIREGGDLSDWFDIAGNSSSKLLQLAENALTPSQFIEEYKLNDANQLNSVEGDSEKVLFEMNKEFAVVTIGNRISIMKESTDDYYSKSDFNTLLQNKSEINDKTRSLWWLSHPERRQYEQIDFLPGISTPAGTFNLWKGFAVKPKGGLEDIPKFHELLEDVICSDNDSWSKYLWSWLAHIIQKPYEKPGVAIVLRSDWEGVGKGVFAKYFGSLLGNHFTVVTEGRHLHGNFNAHQKKCLFLLGDEAVWGGDKRAEAKLKEMITEPTTICEFKGKDSFQIKSFIRLMLQTNSEWAAPVSLTDRRYFVLDVSEMRLNDHVFFKEVENEKKNGGAEALLNVLQQFDLSDFEVREFPDTPARQEQKLLSMQPLEEWWYSLLNNADTIIHDQVLKIDEINIVQKSHLLENFNQHAKEHNYKHRAWSAQRFGLQIKKLLPKLETSRSSGQPRVFKFPSLKECQISFTKKYGLQFENDLNIP